MLTFSLIRVQNNFFLLLSFWFRQIERDWFSIFFSTHFILLRTWLTLLDFDYFSVCCFNYVTQVDLNLKLFLIYFHFAVSLNHFGGWFFVSILHSRKNNFTFIRRLTLSSAFMCLLKQPRSTTKVSAEKRELFYWNFSLPTAHSYTSYVHILL